MKTEDGWIIGKWVDGEMHWHGIGIEVCKNSSFNGDEWLARLVGEGISIVRVRCGPYQTQESAEKALCLWLDTVVDIGKASL